MTTAEIATGLKWAWDNKAEIGKAISSLRDWFRDTGKPQGEPGILILGPGGSGKSTLAKLLCGEADWLTDTPPEYIESIGIERRVLKDAPAVSVVVPPGQPFRRDATWTDLLNDLAQGKYRGVILVTAYGHASFTTPGSYKDHRLYDGKKGEFWERFTAREREDEIDVLKRLSGALSLTTGKVWLLSVVVKQDLWWSDRVAVEQHYRTGPYHEALVAAGLLTRPMTFRHEPLFASLVISNLRTHAGETLQENAKGYDQALEVASIRRLYETVDSLRGWEKVK